MDYTVVFEGAGNLNHKGIRTFRDFSGKEEFEAKLTAGEVGDIVVAAGVTREEAIRKCSEMTFADFEAAAYLEATKNGRFNENEYDRYMSGWRIVLDEKLKYLHGK